MKCNNNYFCFRYITKNVSSLKSFRKYAEDIPQFLQEKPEAFVKHCLKRLGTSDLSVTNTAEHFVVNSDSGASYQVNTDVPACTCLDWQQYNWPCKHILKVMLDYPAYGWEFLPETYRNLPSFNLDTTFDMEDSEEEETVYQEEVEMNVFAHPDEEQALRCELLEIMKELQNDIYLLPFSGLVELKGDLQSASNVVAKHRPEGLPVRAKAAKRRPRVEKDREAEPIPTMGDEIDQGIEHYHEQ